MTPSSMITAMVEDMVRESLDKPVISMSSDIEMTMNLFRQFMFKNVYLAPALIPDRNKGISCGEKLIYSLYGTS